MSMPENGAAERRAITGLAIKWIHVVVVIGFYLVTVGAIYATMRTQVDELREQSKQTVTAAQFQEFKQAIEQRLSRMENTLDRIALKKSIQELH